MQNSSWPPGGHIGQWIATKIDRAPPLIHTITPVKYEVDWPRTSQVMERNGKSEMATWWPHWKPDHDQNREGTSPNPPRYAKEIWNQSSHPFLSYGAECGLGRRTRKPSENIINYVEQISNFWSEELLQRWFQTESQKCEWSNIFWEVEMSCHNFWHPLPISSTWNLCQCFCPVIKLPANSIVYRTCSLKGKKLDNPCSRRCITGRVNNGQSDWLLALICSKEISLL
jgi:hypothetical protein